MSTIHFQHRTPIEIRYADTDQMGVVHHAVFPLYTEIARTRFLEEEIGIPYHQMEREGIYLMVVDMGCRYRFPARYGEPLYVLTGVKTLNRRVLEFAYQIHNGKDDRLLFTGTSKHLFSKRTEAAGVCPPELWSLFSRFVPGPAENR